MIERLATLFFEKGDIGHVALFLWAASASALALILLRELGRTSSRFEAFVMAIARLNAMLSSIEAPSVSDQPNKPISSRDVHHDQTERSQAFLR